MSVTQQNGKLVGRSTEKRQREAEQEAERQGVNEKCSWVKASPQQELWAKLTQARARLKEALQDQLNTTKSVVDLTKRNVALTEQLRDAMTETASVRAENLQLRLRLTNKEMAEIENDKDRMLSLAELAPGQTLTDNGVQWGIESEGPGWFVVDPKKTQNPAKSAE